MICCPRALEVTVRYAAEHNETTREHVLDAASRLFREHGIAAVGLAKVMGEVGLTVGTFYTHFDSKEALLNETLARALDARHRELDTALKDGDVGAAVRSYLSREHRDHAATGCPVSALAAEIARHPRATRRTFSAHHAPSLDMVAKCLSRSRAQPVDRAEAAAFFGLLSGTLQLARATADRVESDAILEAGVRAAMQLAKSRPE